MAREIESYAVEPRRREGVGVPVRLRRRASAVGQRAGAGAPRIQALSRAAVRLKDPHWFDVARSGLGIFRTPPPSGVRDARRRRARTTSPTPTRRGSGSTTPSCSRSSGLHDFAVFANDPLGRRLYLDGVRRARVEIRCGRHRLVVALPAGRRLGPRLPQGPARLHARPLLAAERRPSARGDRAARAPQGPRGRPARVRPLPGLGPVLHRPAALQPLPLRAAEGARAARALGLSAASGVSSPRWLRGRSSTRARAASARRRSPPRPRGASPRAGRRTLLVSTDPAHSLADVLGVDGGLAPDARPRPDLDVQQISAQDELDRHWSEVQDWLGDLLVRKGVDRIAAEELTVLPGMDELFGLLEIGRHYDDGFYDVDRRRLRARPARRCACSRSPTPRAGGSTRRSRSRAGWSRRRARSRAACRPRARWTTCSASPAG